MKHATIWPASDQGASVWLVFTEGFLPEDRSVRSVRIFSSEPSRAFLDAQKGLFEKGGEYDRVQLDVFRVALDHFDGDETN